MGEEGKEKKQKKKQKHKHSAQVDRDDGPNNQYQNEASCGQQKHSQPQQVPGKAGAKPTGAPAAKKKSADTSDAHFKPSSDVKGIRFGVQFIIKSFTVRRAAPMELLRLLDVPMPSTTQPQPQQTNRQETPHPPVPPHQHQKQPLPFPSATAYIPTNFTILAHHAWHTLTLGLGTKKSKVVLFVFESEAMKQAADRLYPSVVALGEVNKRLIRGLSGCEMARFKFRKGALTFYVYAARRIGANGFARADDLRKLLESVVALNDFLDHTAMLAIPTQRSITFASQQQHPVAMAH